MDIIVHIPHEHEDYVWGTKFCSRRGFDQAYWTVSRKPRYAGKGDRIWFCNLDRVVVASAPILYLGNSGPPLDATCPPGTTEEERERREYKPCIIFNPQDVVRHEFDMPRRLQHGFRGFRYVRRADPRVPVRKTRALELVSAERAHELFLRES
jgi:hypothetical protein